MSQQLKKLKPQKPQNLNLQNQNIFSGPGSHASSPTGSPHGSRPPSATSAHGSSTNVGNLAKYQYDESHIDSMLKELLLNAQDSTNELQNFLNCTYKGAGIKLALIPFLSKEYKIVTTGGKRFNKKGGTGEIEEDIEEDIEKNVIDARSFALACLNKSQKSIIVYENEIYENEIYEKEPKANNNLAPRALNAINDHREKLDEICRSANILLKTYPQANIDEFKEMCANSGDALALIPGVVPTKSQKNYAKYRNEYIFYIASAMLDLVAHINRTRAKNFMSTCVQIHLDNNSIIKFTVNIEESKGKKKYILTYIHLKKEKEIEIEIEKEIVHVGAIHDAIVGLDIKINIVHVETTMLKDVTAIKAIEKLEGIAINYFENIAQRARINEYQVQQFVTVRNIHFLYVLKSPKELRREAKEEAAADAADAAAKGNPTLRKTARDKARETEREAALVKWKNAAEPKIVQAAQARETEREAALVKWKNAAEPKIVQEQAAKAKAAQAQPVIIPDLASTATFEIVTPFESEFFLLDVISKLTDPEIILKKY
jgi:hypothetical protein